MTEHSVLGPGLCGVADRAQTLESDRPGIKPLLCLLLDVRPQTGALTSLRLGLQFVKQELKQMVVKIPFSCIL